MYIEQLVECADCKDRFIIIYDSRKKEQNKSTCKCGKLVCTPKWSGFSYSHGGKTNKIPSDEWWLGFKQEYYDEDYIKLTKEEQTILDDINEIGNLIKKDYIYREKITDKNILLCLEGTDQSSKECIYIFFNISIRADTNPYTEKDIENIHRRLLEGLNRFKNLITKVKNKEIDINKPRAIVNDKTLEWLDFYKHQKKLYDYELYC